MNVKPKTMFTGDNLPIMRGMDTDSVDLIYLDPPFNSKKQWSAPIGSKAAGAAFKDAWTLSDIDVADLGILAEERPKLSSLINSIGDVNGSGDKSYLLMMASRLVEMQRLLKPTGSIYLHCDPTMSHSLKLLMDSVFGRENFRNELVWQYSTFHASKRAYKKNYDQILFYSSGKNYHFDWEAIADPYDPLTVKRFDKTDGDGRYKIVKGKKFYIGVGTPPSACFFMSQLQMNSAERVGYPTQKPMKLLQRVIKASSNEGDVVLDPFCGCATACLAAESLDRNWIGIDLSSKAIDLVKQRFANELAMFNPNIIHRTDIPIRSDGVVRSKNIKHVLYGKQEGYCNACGRHFEFRNFEVDHVIAKASGGADDDSNLQLLCGSCNKIKGKKSMGELFASLEEMGIVYGKQKG